MESYLAMAGQLTIKKHALGLNICNSQGLRKTFQISNLHLKVQNVSFIFLFLLSDVLLLLQSIHLSLRAQIKNYIIADIRV